MTTEYEGLRKEVSQNSEAISRIIKFLFGNGNEIGLDETMRNMDNSVKNLCKDFSDYKTEQKEKEKARLRKRENVQIGIIVALVTNVITWIGAAIIFFARISPLLLQLESQVP